MNITKNWKRSIVNGTLLAAVLLFAQSANGEIRTWTNTGEGSWSEPANWGGTEPTMADAAYIVNGGTSVCENAEVAGTFWLGENVGGDGTLRLDDPSASLTVAGAAFYWGRRATGTVIQTDGMLVVSNTTQMGYFSSGLAKYVISGGTGTFHGTLTVGVNVGSDFGNGLILQSGGLVRFNKDWGITANGYYELTGGTVDSSAMLNIISGRMLIDGSSAVLKSTAGALVYVNNSTAIEGAVLDIRNGLVTNLGFYVGHQRSGTVNQTGGLVTQPAGRSVALGTYSSGNGTWNLHGGTLALGKHGTPYNSLEIGQKSGATGTVYIGSVTGCGILTQQVAGTGMYVGSGGTGSLVGWSDEGAGEHFFLTGPCYLNRGYLIADGYGTDRALDLTSLASVGSTLNNVLDGTFGCYSRNHGELRLPSIAVSGNTTTYWGDQGSVDLINSAKLVLTGASGTLTGKLFAVDHGEVPPLASLRAISVHDFSVGGMTACTLSIRYDHQAAAAAKIDEEALKLYQWSGSGWTKVSSTVDTGTRTISTSGLTSLGWFAIGSPASGTTLMVR